MQRDLQSIVAMQILGYGDKSCRGTIENLKCFESVLLSKLVGFLKIFIVENVT